MLAATIGLRLNEIAIPVISSARSVSIAAIASGKNGSFEFSIALMLSKPFASAALAAGPDSFRFSFGNEAETRIETPFPFWTLAFIEIGLTATT